MDVNSEAIYGADPSPFEMPEWGRYTTKDNLIYAHLFDWPEGGLLNIPELSGIGKLGPDDRTINTTFTKY